jgi:ethanolamine utilization protein EutN
MTYGEVVGSLWATIQEKDYQGKKLLIVEGIDLAEGTKTGETIIAIDLVDAGIGDKVLVIYEGGSARLALKDEKTCAEAVVAGVVDQIKLIPSYETRRNLR